jgi:hypothetical protein
MPAPPEVVSDLLVGARLLVRLPAFARRPVGVDEARRELARRLETRGATFLDLVRGAVYTRPESPYAQLLRHAGCEYGDLAGLVCADGVEGALQALLEAGVYLTVEELKGRRPVRRGATTIEADPVRLRNPLAGCDLPIHSGGSRSRGTPVGWDLAFVWDRAVDLCLTQVARGPKRRRYGVWGVPGSGAIIHLLDVTARGAVPERWFSQVDPRASVVAARYRGSVSVVRVAAWLGGARLPAPMHAPLDAPEPVISWLDGVLRDAETPELLGYPSAILRLAEAALRKGIRLDGAEVITGGEPVTAARLAVMRRAGIRVLPRYAMIEGGLVGDACLAPEAADDVHVLSDLLALIQPGDTVTLPAVPPGALLVSTLRPTAPLILLNASTGDGGVLDPRPCDCPLGVLGWTTRLRAIRSFEKLTAEGMTFLDADVTRVLEDTLPARFGGSLGDYQIVEDEGPDGRARLRLLIHPGVGPVDPHAVTEAFLSALGPPGGTARIMTQVWRNAGLLAVERHAPLATMSGKILHLHRTGRGPDRVA